MNFCWGTSSCKEIAAGCSYSVAKHRARDGLEPPDELELEELDELEEFDELELDELLDDEPGSMGFFLNHQHMLRAELEKQLSSTAS
jgi:hypothetical protein